MVMWRYFVIDQGFVWKYIPVGFNNKSKLVKPFSVTNSTNRFVSTCSSKKRATREFCNLHFCLENGFIAAFDDQLQLEQHMLSEQHTYKSGMDKVKL